MGRCTGTTRHEGNSTNDVARGRGYHLTALKKPLDRRRGTALELELFLLIVLAWRNFRYGRPQE